MSGICGISRSEGGVSRSSVEAMVGMMRRSDETEGASIIQQQIGLGVSRRWNFQQVFQTSGISLAFDADLYNRRDLAAEVSANGDTSPHGELGEILVSLYKADGHEFLKRLEGAFSLALWDEESNSLLLATDPLGIKTLYWREEGDSVLFASHAGAVAAVQQPSPEVQPASIAQFLLFSCVPAPMTIYRGIEKLRPGSFLTFRRGGVSQQNYWQLDYTESSDRDPVRWASSVREELRAAVHRNLDGCSGNDTGAYLSGGTDSSSVVAFMAERFPKVNSFSIAFPETGFNEIEFARTTARRFRTNHFEQCVGPDDVLKAIPVVAGYYDQPFANSSALASYCCARLARQQGMATLLAGDGGDELFAGNERYSSDKRFGIYGLLPGWLRKGLIEPFAGLLPRGDTPLSLPRRYIRRANIPNPKRILSYSAFLTHDPAEMFHDDFIRNAPVADWLSIAEEHFNSPTGASELNRLMHLDVKIILADNDLRKVSGTAELAGIKVRYPMLDRRLAEFSGRIPTPLKMKGFKKRFIFKKAMEGILPEKVLHKKKHGFGVPIGLWFLRDKQLSSFVHDVLADPKTQQRGYFKREFYDRVTDLHQHDHAGFYGEVIWYLVALELWHRQHFECLSSRGVCAD